MEIRDAVPEDAPAACLVLRRSIAELCAGDHGEDAAILARWLANKTPPIVASWIAQPGNHLLLAVEGEAVLAVGSVTDAGQITLNYVSPDARFRGVSTALLAALEARAEARGRDAVRLTSTRTARRFYLARGYAEAGPPESKFGIEGQPMRKSLRPEGAQEEDSMLDHVGLPVTDLAKSQTFYEKALKPLGVRLIAGDGAHYAGFGTGEKGFFWLGPTETPPTRVHVAFASEDRDTVHRFYEAALAAGGTDNGTPGLRPEYHPNYYGAFVLDPDGHNIEAVCHKPV